MKTKPRKKAPGTKTPVAKTHDLAWVDIKEVVCKNVLVESGGTVTLSRGCKVVLPSGTVLAVEKRGSKGGELVCADCGPPVPYVPQEPSEKNRQVDLLRAARDRLFRYLASCSEREKKLPVLSVEAVSNAEPPHLHVTTWVAEHYKLPKSVMGFPVKAYDENYGETETDNPEDLVFAPEK